MKFKKPKFWDLKKPNLASILLKPLTLPIKINNFYLNFKTKKKIHNIKTICVGNIYLGGTGKTPTSIKLYNILKELNFNVATAKKYYPNQKDEQTILKIKTKFILEITRTNIIKKALKENIELLIFDDGLQDKQVFYDIQFVCFDGTNWIGNGCLIPSGPLREQFNSIKKFDGIFLKDIFSDQEKIISEIKKCAPNIKIFNTVSKPKNLKKHDLNSRYIIFSGIGNPNSFKNTLLKNNFKIEKEIIFPDHYNYVSKDIQKIKSQAQKLNAKIITTEKDYVKILENDRSDINYLEIDLEVEEEQNLINFLKKRLNEQH